MTIAQHTSDAEKYQHYLCSREWWVRREAVRERCKGICERCKEWPMTSVHHLTNARKYDEPLEDLQALCDGCHAFTHGKSDVDPMHVAEVIYAASDFAATVEAHLRLKPNKPDIDALNRFSWYLCEAFIGNVAVPIVAPKEAPRDHAQFDKAICRAGVTCFVRATMASDHPGHGTVIKGTPLPGEFHFGKMLIVMQLAPGIRIRHALANPDGSEPGDFPLPEEIA